MRVYDQNPRRGLFEITPDDNNDLAEPCVGFNVEAAGTITYTLDGGAESSLYIAAGTHLLACGFVKRVKSTGTTATGIRGIRQ